MGAVDWNTAALVLGVGLVLGVILVVSLGKRSGTGVVPAAVPLERRDLEGKRDALLLQLRELEDTAVKRTAAQLARERYALEVEAAQAWQELDRLSAARPPAKAAAKGRRAEEPAPAVSAAPQRASLRGFLWGVGTAGAIGLLLFYASRVIQPREQGGSLTGNLPAMGEPGPAVDPEEQREEQRLREALAKNPDDHDVRVELAQLYLGRQDLMAVWNETKYVLDRVPTHPRALAYQALVRLAMGQGDAAVEMLKQAQASGPGLLEPHLHLALVYSRLGRMEEAESTIAEAQRRFPKQAERLGQLMAQMRRAAAEPSEEGAPTPEERATPAPAARDARAVAGVIELDARRAGTVPENALVFLIARAVGEAAGPPVAVKRLPASFPLRFELSAMDSMMGQALPDRLRLEARVDSDGNPLTRTPEDPSARLDDVAIGTANLKLVLK